MEKETCRLKVLGWYTEVLEPNLEKIQNNWQESKKHLPNIKSTTYVAEITTQKNEKYLSEGRNPLAYSPTHFVSTKKFSAWVYRKKSPFLINQTARFISRGIGRSYFSGNFLLSFLLWYDFKILVKSRVVNVQQKYSFFQFRDKYSEFHLLDLDEQFWIWFS